MAKERKAVRIGGRTLSVSNLDKPLYPGGFTKGQLIDYYTRIAPFILPHLRNRPITFKRYPDGVNAPFFFEKKCNVYRPPWVKAEMIAYTGDNKPIEHCVLRTAADLAWAGNIAAIELHVSLATAKRIDRPTMIVFDLDPGPGTDLLDCARVAFRLRKMASELALESIIKTSGGKGLHFYIPLNTPVTYDQTQPFALALATVLASEDPKRVTAVMAKAQRVGKVYVDWAQNMEHKTTVCVYSVRARDEPTVSTPITWEELERAVAKRSIKSLEFDAPAVLKRVEELGDLFEGSLRMKQKLPALDAVAEPA